MGGGGMWWWPYSSLRPPISWEHDIYHQLHNLLYWSPRANTLNFLLVNRHYFYYCGTFSNIQGLKYNVAYSYQHIIEFAPGSKLSTHFCICKFLQGNWDALVIFYAWLLTCRAIWNEFFIICWLFSSSSSSYWGDGSWFSYSW